MRPTALVITTVHWPDDTRIRERLIRTLASDLHVRYATRSPGPTDLSDLDYVELSGGRLRRNLGAFRIALRSHWDVLVLHDPELIPVGAISRVLKGKPVVFDVHEDYPAVARTREWVPAWMRRTLAWIVSVAFRLAEKLLTITLAEAGYQSLFRNHAHPVFPNYPDTSEYPAVQGERNEEAVYLGDATQARGVDLAVEASSLSEIPLRLIGRVAPELEVRLATDPNVEIEGVLPNPEAIRHASKAAVGLVPLRDLPNYRNSQPTKLLEYLALGVPVVASDLPGTRTLVNGLDAVWLVPAGDAGAMASAMSEARSESSRQAASRQADMIRARFRWPAEEVRSFYVSLVSH